jgi:hypothetical protein
MLRLVQPDALFGFADAQRGNGICYFEQQPGAAKSKNGNTHKSGQLYKEKTRFAKEKTIAANDAVDAFMCEHTCKQHARDSAMPWQGNTSSVSSMLVRLRRMTIRFETTALTSPIRIEWGWSQNLQPE